MAKVGEVFSKTVMLSEQDVVDFAARSGDDNPLHHDRGYAATTRYTRLVACAAHYTSLFMGLASSHFARVGPAVGVEYSFNFLRPVLAGDTITMQWEVADVMATHSMGGQLVRLTGSMTNQLSKVVLTATGKLLLTEKL